MTVDYIPFTELLSDIIDNRGRTCPTSNTGIPLIATNCIRNDLLYPVFENIRYVSKETIETWFRGHPKPGDIIFVNKGTPGRVCMVPDPVRFCIAQDMVAIRADQKKIYPKYLFAVLRSSEIQTQIENMHVGTLIPHFKKGDFDKLLVPVPDRKTQEIIGNNYFTLSNKIELNRRMNETLEAMARAIFKSWFVDFDPVRAKAEGKKPAGMDAETAALFPSEFETVDGREVPKGWRVVKLGELSSLDKGVSYKGDFLSDEGISMINLGCFTGEGKFSIDNLKFYSGEYRERHVVKPGDIVLANTDITQKREVLGSPAIVPPFSQFNRSIFTHHVYAIRFKKEFETLNYVVYFSLLNPDFRERAIGFATGTTVLALPRDTLLEYSLVIPDEKIIQQFNNAIKPLFSLIYNNIEQSSTLAQLRDALLPKLMSGEIILNSPPKISGL